MSRKIFNTDINERIRLIRQTKKLSQQAFAGDLGIGQGFLSELEQCKYEPTRPLLLAICYLYQINLEWFLTGKGSMFRSESEESRYAPDELKYMDMLIEILRGNNQQGAYAVKLILDQTWNHRNEHKEAQDVSQQVIRRLRRKGE